jgi:hypothetical protein
MIRSLPSGQLWRYAQAGDLPGVGERINMKMLRGLVRANKGKRGFTYTHKTGCIRNFELIEEATADGFTINLSANGLEHADILSILGGPVVTMIPLGSPISFKTKDGHTVRTCPAQYRGTTCEKCGLCAVADRKFIVGFLPHGSGKKRADVLARSM